MFSTLDIISHLSNALFTIGTGFRNVLYLRAALIVAAILEIVYDFSVIPGKPLWAPIFWGSTLIIINTYQILRVVYEKRFLNLSHDELRLFDMIGNKMDVLNFKKFIRAGKWEIYAGNKTIITENQATKKLFLLTDGEAEVTINNKPVSKLNPGCFMGEMSFLSGELPSASVFTITDSKIISWEKTKLTSLMTKNKEIRNEIHSLLSNDLIAKIIDHNQKGIL